MSTDNFLLGVLDADARFQSIARTAELDGTRSYQLSPDDQSGVLVDEHGRLIVRSVASEIGYDYPGAGQFPHPVAVLDSGSAPEYDGVGLVQTHQVMDSPNNLGGTAGGRQTVLRMFGYVAAAGWVQLHLKDVSGGPNPPVLNDVPEITIAVGANQNFYFGNWQLAMGSTGPQKFNYGTYIAFSTTGPTFTPGGANLWFAFYGFV